MQHRRRQTVLSRLGPAVVLAGALIAAGGSAAAAAAAAPLAPLPTNCERDSLDFTTVRCTWTAGLGNRFTVPRGVTSVSVIAVGARGGDNITYGGTSAIPGGRGGVGRATLDFGADGPSGLGRTVLVDVGTPGGTGYNSYDFGGGGGEGGAPGGGDARSAGPVSLGAGGGGGYSALRLIGAPAGVDARVVVGGGGGGASYGTGRSTLGGDAGQSANRRQGGGSAGTAATGGAGGTGTDPLQAGADGRYRAGGDGGAYQTVAGGGGGGGIYGGGGGRGGGTSATPFGGGGGGGSSTGGSREISSSPAAVALSFTLPLQ